MECVVGVQTFGGTMRHLRMLVLANSYKNHGRCVAGPMIESGGGFGRWCRPTGEGANGALEPPDMQTDGDVPIRVLDIFDVPVLGWAKDPCHPEDWVLGRGIWKKVGKMTTSDLTAMEDHPQNLWLTDRDHCDRIECDGHTNDASFRSLYLIRPQRLRIRTWKEHDKSRKTEKLKTRAVFLYRGFQYSFSLTDPLLGRRYPVKFPEVDQPPMEMPIGSGDNCLLCVSLTPMFNGYHYKVAATVMEL